MPLYTTGDGGLRYRIFCFVFKVGMSKAIFVTVMSIVKQKKKGEIIVLASEQVERSLRQGFHMLLVFGLHLIFESQTCDLKQV